MKRVTGIGGIFFKAEDPADLKEWYVKHLGIPMDDDGYICFYWKEKEDPKKEGFTVWEPFDEESEYFEPSEKPFMMNFRVDNLKALLEKLREEGVEVIDDMEEHDYGKFGWILDPEGNKIELWEPSD